MLAAAPTGWYGVKVPERFVECHFLRFSCRRVAALRAGEREGFEGRKKHVRVCTLSRQVCKNSTPEGALWQQLDGRIVLGVRLLR